MTEKALDHLIQTTSITFLDLINYPALHLNLMHTSVHAVEAQVRIEALGNFPIPDSEALED